MTLYRNLISHLEQANLPPQSHRFLITLLSPWICTRLFLPLLFFVHSAWIQPGIFFSGTMHVLQYKVTLEPLYIPSDGSPVNWPCVLIHGGLPCNRKRRVNCHLYLTETVNINVKLGSPIRHDDLVIWRAAIFIHSSDLTSFQIFSNIL